MRWAQWFEEAGELIGVPEAHCMRYRSQREQVAAVWANNRRTFLSTDEHVDALVQSLDELDGLVAGADHENDWTVLNRAPWFCQPATCTVGGVVLYRRLFGLAGQQ